MKANELRLGNEVFYDDETICTVVGIPYGSTTVELAGCERFISITDIEPIPLSPEILEKCGFNKYKDVSGYTALPCWRNNFIGVEYREKIKVFTIVWYDANDDYGTTMASCKITNLHQLQNLYFALTGTELKVNL